MKNRGIIFWTVVIAFIGGLILFASLNKNNSSKGGSINIYIPTNQISNSVSDNNIKTGTINDIQQTDLYTLAEVSKHNNQTSCWTIINGKIYDITSFISSHPAGVQKILQGCGIDATKLYGRVGAHDVSKLSNFVVGILK
jgi:cytochrome b involved in lipid metabolism